MNHLIAHRVTEVFGAELSESEAALRVFLAAGGLVMAGFLLLLLTIRWWRHTRPEPPALGPLEVMGDRKWATSADSERRRLIEEFRPVGAEPSNRFVEPQKIDLSILAREAPPSFDDLREPAADPEALEIASSTAADAASSAPVEAVESNDGVESSESVGEIDPVEEVEEVEGFEEVEEVEEVEGAEPSTLASPSPSVDPDGPVPFAVPEYSGLPQPALHQVSDAGDDSHQVSDGDDTVAMVSPELPVSPNAGG